MQSGPDSERRVTTVLPGRPSTPVIFVLGDGPIDTSKLTRKVFEQQTRLTVEWRPKYAPELRHIERSWRDLKR
jgi:transposase